MKSIMETSFYLLLMTLFCYANIDFVLMNQQVSRVNEVEQYIEDYIEVHGSALEDNGLDAYTAAAAKETADKNGMQFSCTYVGKTRDYVYYKIKLQYTLRTAFLKLERQHAYTGFARVSYSGHGGGG